MTPRASADDRIRPYDGNPFYWQYRGKPVLLLGGSVEDNLFQIPGLVRELDTLKECGGNYVRCTMSSRDEGNVWPFARMKNGKYDLQNWNPEYWKRFATFLRETHDRRIVVQVEVWATFDFYREPWLANPFNPANNVTYTAQSSGLPVKVESHPVETGNDFFRSVPGVKNLKTVLGYQEEFVRKMLSGTLDYDHVLYCIDNETSVGPQWSEYWAEFIRSAARGEGKSVEVTEMWDPWDLSHPMHANTLDHPETYSFIEVSQNNHQSGQTHYANALAHRNRAAVRPRPLTSVKIYGADGGRFGSSRDGIERFWRNVFAGLSAARFHRPDSGIGLSAAAQRQIKSARRVTGSFDLFACEPRNDLIGNPKDDLAYCLADPGTVYAVYFPAGGSVTLDARGTGRQAEVEWFDINAGGAAPPKTVKGAGPVKLKPPSDKPFVALVR